MSLIFFTPSCSLALAVLPENFRFFVVAGLERAFFLSVRSGNLIPLA
jgi:hypothetical protein